jgi:hypothetical protein
MRPMLFGLAALLSSPVSAAAEWLTFEEGKSPLDDSPTLAVSLSATPSGEFKRVKQPDLVLQCKERMTTAYFYKPYTFFGSTAVKINLRIGDGKATETRWDTTMNGRAVLAPNGIQFIRLLPENGRIFIRAHAYSTIVEGQFDLGNVSIVRNKLARACKWPPDPQQKK